MISVNQSTLKVAIGMVGRAASSRSAMPILSNILLAAGDGSLCLAATNREIALRCLIPARTNGETFATTIPAKLLVDYVGQLSGRLDLDYAADKETLTVIAEKSRATIKGLPAADFPLFPSDTDGVAADLDVDDLIALIDGASHAASTDESRPTMTAVEVSLKPNCVQMAATDGYRLALRTVEPGIGEQPQVILVPAASLQTLSAILSGMNVGGMIRVSATEDRLHVSVPGDGETILNLEMVCDLIDAKYPDYNAIIPKQNDLIVVVDRRAMLDACKVAMLFARDNNNIIRFRFTQAGRIEMSATSAEMGESHTELQAETVRGDGDLEIAFNGKYLIQALEHVTGDLIEIGMTHPTRPATIRPRTAAPGEHLQVIMPMHQPR